MRHIPLACALLLHVLFLHCVQANTQTFDQAFDYDVALATSQAAVGNSVGVHRFTNADGKAVTLDQFRGKPLVVSMIFTSCFQICPMTTRHLSTVVEKARDALGEDSFNVALIGFDSAVDTPDAMRFFANKQGIYGRNWQLLSTDEQTVEALSRDLGFLFYPASNGFDHLIQATIIDAGGKVYRQVYGQVFDTPLLVDPLIELVLGRAAPEQPLLSNLVQRIKLFCTTYDPARDGYYFDYSLFVGMLIGASIIGIAGTVVVRGWRHSRRPN
jgi:protein SCO1/2